MKRLSRLIALSLAGLFGSGLAHAQGIFGPACTHGELTQCVVRVNEVEGNFQTTRSGSVIKFRFQASDYPKTKAELIALVTSQLERGLDGLPITALTDLISDTGSTVMVGRYSVEFIISRQAGILRGEIRQ